MRTRHSIPGLALALAFGLFAAGTARADDKADCAAGIDFIRAEIAKNPDKPVLDALKKALRGAEREDREKQYDECVDYVKAAHKAVGR